MAQSTGLPPPHVELAARRQVYAAVKSRVLGAAAAASASSTLTTPAGGNSSTSSSTGPSATQAAPAQGPVQVLTDYSHLPVVFVSVNSPEELARLKSSPDVLSVAPNKRVRATSSAALDLIGQPTVARSWKGKGTVVTLDSGETGACPSWRY